MSTGLNHLMAPPLREVCPALSQLDMNVLEAAGKVRVESGISQQITGSEDHERQVPQGANALHLRAAGGDIDPFRIPGGVFISLCVKAPKALQVFRLVRGRRGELFQIQAVIIGMRRVNQHQASHLIRMLIGAEGDSESALRVTDQEIWRRNGGTV